jgi:hypothetical protein
VDFDPTYRYPWQNPYLRKTIYPFRERKLRDFLLTYREIDIWKVRGRQPPDPAIAAELLKEHQRIASRLQAATLEKESAKNALRAHRQTRASVYNNPEVRKLSIEKVTQSAKRANLEATKKSLERRVDWYRINAPDHPYYEKFKNELIEAIAPYNKVLEQVKQMELAYREKIGPFLEQETELNEKIQALTREITALKEAGLNLPRLDKSGAVTASAAVRWEMQKYRQELEAKTHDELLSMILDRFDAEPERFPAWLRYMVIHFSGMRYQSAHASWADPKDLLKALTGDALGKQIAAEPESDAETQAAQAIAELEKLRSQADTKWRPGEILSRINRLKSQLQRRAELLKLRIEQAADEIDQLDGMGVLGRLKDMKDQFPSWMWAEIVQRTQLRLVVTDDQWETLTPQQRQERWARENQRWRQIMDAWETKDITAWRQEHRRTLALVVSRAVCNEVSEHIQHLRGVAPAAGLTSKPPWYLRNQAAAPGKVYFKRPGLLTDFKNGASILFLGWVQRQPNAWQIAHPLTGIDLLPPGARPVKFNKRYVKDADPDWTYRLEGDYYIRFSNVAVQSAAAQPAANVKAKDKKKKEKDKPPKSGPNVGLGKATLVREWLRWTHEAIVVEVAEMAGGTFVLTFETGQIGLNLRPAGRLVNAWDIFVGYVPENPDLPGDLELTLADMIKRENILA